MSDITIVRATLADTPAILSLLERSHLPVAGLIEHSDEILVARRAGEVVGSAALEVYGEDALLRSVAVDLTRRGNGVGQQLTEAALARAKERGLRSVYLLTTTAEEFFPRFGFSRIERADVPFGIRQSVEFASACPASAVVMRKPIGAAASRRTRD